MHYVYFQNLQYILLTHYTESNYSGFHYLLTCCLVLEVLDDVPILCGLIWWINYLYLRPWSFSSSSFYANQIQKQWCLLMYLYTKCFPSRCVSRYCLEKMHCCPKCMMKDFLVNLQSKCTVSNLVFAAMIYYQFSPKEIQNNSTAIGNRFLLIGFPKISNNRWNENWSL